MRELLILLLGAFVGGVVGFGVERIKTLLDRRSLKNQLYEEMRTNLNMLPFLRQHMTDSLHMAKHGGSPNMRAVHFCTACYDAHFAAVLPILSGVEQVSIQVIYEYLRICNEVTDAYSTIVFSTASKDEHERLLRIYASTIDSAIGMTQKTEEFIQAHLVGAPKDLFSKLA